MPNVNKQSPRTTVSPTNRIPTNSADPWALVDTLRMLVYGQSGTGKTTFVSSFPSPILWLVCSGGAKPGELRSIDTPENRKRITPRIIHATSQLHACLTEAQEYQTVVLDHASGLMDLILKELLGLEEIPVQKGWGTASQQQYGTLAQQCKEWFRALLSLPGNVVLIAQERTFGGKDDGGDPDIIKPTVNAALTPSITGWLCPACDYVVQTYKAPRTREIRTTLAGKEHITHQRDKGVNYMLRIGPHDTFMTKFRVPRRAEPLPEAIPLHADGEDYQRVINIIKGTT